MVQCGKLRFWTQKWRFASDDVPFQTGDFFRFQTLIFQGVTASLPLKNSGETDPFLLGWYFQRQTVSSREGTLTFSVAVFCWRVANSIWCSKHKASDISLRIRKNMSFCFVIICSLAFCGVASTSPHFVAKWDILFAVEISGIHVWPSYSLHLRTCTV